MTTKSSQPTNGSGQDEKQYNELRVDTAGLCGELVRTKALLLETARALGLDISDVDDLPQKAAAILAEGSAACQAWDEKCRALQWDYDEAML